MISKQEEGLGRGGCPVGISLKLVSLRSLEMGKENGELRFPSWVVFHGHARGERRQEEEGVSLGSVAAENENEEQ